VHTVIPADAHDRMHITTYNHPASANLHGKSASSRHHAVMKLYVLSIAKQRPREVGSAVAERVGQGEVGWYTQRVKTAWPCMGWLRKYLSRAISHILSAMVT